MNRLYGNRFVLLQLMKTKTSYKFQLNQLINLVEAY